MGRRGFVGLIVEVVEWGREDCLPFLVFLFPNVRLVVLRDLLLPGVDTQGDGQRVADAACHEIVVSVVDEVIDYGSGMNVLHNESF